MEGLEFGRVLGSLAEAILAVIVRPAGIRYEAAKRLSLFRILRYDAAMRPCQEVSMIWIVTVILTVLVLRKLRLSYVGPTEVVSTVSESANAILNRGIRAARVFLLDVVGVKETASKTLNDFCYLPNHCNLESVAFRSGDGVRFQSALFYYATSFAHRMPWTTHNNLHPPEARLWSR